MYSLIYSADNAFQVISFVKGKAENAWVLANSMSASGDLKKNKIVHYDVMEFKSIDDMNEWIVEQVKESRD